MEKEKKEILEEKENACPSEIEGLCNQIAGLNDKYLRAMAELENTRRRAAIDSESAARGRAVSIAENFLPLVDAINAAALQMPDDEGIKSLVRAAESTLEKIGIAKIETVGQKLNPLLHNAVSVIESNADADVIVEELVSGYTFGDTVLRPAMVIVSK
ncbi:MAG: nucleotide exchange factor GrpE [Alphaproteobacteria bacterium]|nr:nucleotide exchange factor GrpE [Alphaproteobacteria bacterium]